jgi:molecular chaperone GrpE
MSTRRKIPINNYEAGPAESGVASGDAVETTTTIHTAPDESTLDGAERSSPERTPGTASGPETAAGDVAPPPSNDTDAMDELLAEREELGDALLRLRAEFDNYRKRSVQELVESRERAQGEILCDLLPVLDNLERALDAAEHHDEGKVLDGVRMTRDMFVDLLKRTGVEEIETV